MATDPRKLSCTALSGSYPNRATPVASPCPSLTGHCRRRHSSRTNSCLSSSGNGKAAWSRRCATRPATAATSWEARSCLGRTGGDGTPSPRCRRAVSTRRPLRRYPFTRRRPCGYSISPPGRLARAFLSPFDFFSLAILRDQPSLPRREFSTCRRVVPEVSCPWDVCPDHLVWSVCSRRGRV